jgi:tetratricopeptide (TPR) repeat protein
LTWVDLHLAVNEPHAAEWGLRQCQAIVPPSSVWSVRLWARQLRLYLERGQNAQVEQLMASAPSLMALASPAHALVRSECQLARGQGYLARGEFALAYQALSAALQAIRGAWEFQSDTSTTEWTEGDLRMAMYWTLEQVLAGWCELYAHTDQYTTAVAFMRQAVRLLMMIPSTQILEALYILADGVREQGDEATARQIVAALQQGEAAMAQKLVRSEILATKLAHPSDSPADQAAREQLARSLRHRGLGRWISRLDVGVQTDSVEKVSEAEMSDFSPTDFLAQWADALHVPNFASANAALPEILPWKL